MTQPLRPMGTGFPLRAPALSSITTVPCLRQHLSSTHHSSPIMRCLGFLQGESTKQHPPPQKVNLAYWGAGMMREVLSFRLRHLKNPSKNGPGWYCTVVRTSAFTPKGHRFASQSRACTWATGLIPGPSQDIEGRQQIYVSLLY